VSCCEEAERTAEVARDRNGRPLTPQKMKKVTAELLGVEYPEPATTTDRGTEATGEPPDSSKWNQGPETAMSEGL